MNEFFLGDNLEVMRNFEKQYQFQLIYLDPPFASDRVYVNRNGEFDDTYTSSELIQMLLPRIQCAFSLLADNGVLIIHCDWHASHKIRVMLDSVCSEDNFVNEIIWLRSNPKLTTRKLSCDHDTIFVYCKNPKKYTFNNLYIDLDNATIKRYDKVDENGRRFMYRGITAPGSENYWDFDLGEIPPKPFRGYGWSREKIEEGIQSGIIVLSPEKRLCYKAYLDESRGRALDDVWTDINHVQGNENLGYPTQKPIALMERLVQIYTNEDDCVLDVFCGSGTLCDAAFKNHRKFIGIDQNEDAIKICRERVEYNDDTFEL